MIKEHHRNWLGNETRANLGNLTKFIASYFKRKSTDKSGYNWNWRYQLELRSVQNTSKWLTIGHLTPGSSQHFPHTQSSLLMLALDHQLLVFFEVTSLPVSRLFWSLSSSVALNFKVCTLPVCNHLETRVTRPYHVSSVTRPCQVLHVTHGHATCQCYTTVPRVRC